MSALALQPLMLPRELGRWLLWLAAAGILIWAHGCHPHDEDLEPFALRRPARLCEPGLNSVIGH